MCCVQLFHRHNSPAEAPVLPWHLHQEQGTYRFQQPCLPQKFSGLCTVLALRQLYKAATGWHIPLVLPAPLSSHFKTKHKVDGRGQMSHRSRSSRKQMSHNEQELSERSTRFLYQKATRWLCTSSSCKLSLNIFGWIWWQLKCSEHCQSSSQAGSSAWKFNSNSTIVRGWVVWNTHCNQL